MNWYQIVRVKIKGLPKWRWAVYYGDPRWPSHSFWLVPRSQVAAPRRTGDYDDGPTITDMT